MEEMGVEGVEVEAEAEAEAEAKTDVEVEVEGTGGIVEVEVEVEEDGGSVLVEAFKAFVEMEDLIAEVAGTEGKPESDPTGPEGEGEEELKGLEGVANEDFKASDACEEGSEDEVVEGVGWEEGGLVVVGSIGFGGRDAGSASVIWMSGSIALEAEGREGNENGLFLILRLLLLLLLLLFVDC